MYAINTQNGPGKPVGARCIFNEADRLPEETFLLDELPEDINDLVLSENGKSLRKKNNAEKQQEKDKKKGWRADADVAMLETIAELTGRSVGEVRSLYISKLRD